MIRSPSLGEFAVPEKRNRGVVTQEATCKNCFFGRIIKYQDHPIVTWAPGSERLGDLALPSPFELYAQDGPLERLTTEFSSLSVGHTVTFVDEPFAHWDLTKPRVQHPYNGPRFRELLVNAEVPALPESAVTGSSQCDECGNAVPQRLTGVAKRPHESRKPGGGLRVRWEHVRETPVFRTHRFKWIFVTDVFRRFVESQGWTNIAFYDAGQIVGAPASAPPTPPEAPSESKLPPPPPPPLDPVGFRVVRPPNAERIGYSGLVPIVVQHLDEDASLYFGRASLDASLAKATAGQRAVYAIYWLMEEIANGGLEQFFGNSTGMLWEDAVDGLRHVGAEPQAEVLLAAGALFPDGAPPIRRGLRNEQLQPIVASIGAMERELYGAPVSIQQQVFDYILTHPDEFFLPDSATPRTKN